MGHACDESIRRNAASGGMVTALLCQMLDKGCIDGAWVTKTGFDQGKLTYHTYIATSNEEIKEASSSVYMDIPLLSHLDMVREFPGKIAVVMTPCMLAALDHIMQDDRQIREKIYIKLGLYCSGSHDIALSNMVLDKLNIPLDDAKRLYYRRGHWRGLSSVVYRDGSEYEFSYTHTLCAYKNAYFFEKTSCMSCKDHFASHADISFGDIWLKEMKKNPIKYNSIITYTVTGEHLLRSAVESGAVEIQDMVEKDLIRSQRRALNFKYPIKKRHLAAKWLAQKNKEFSFRHPDRLKLIPMWVIYIYCGIIRVMLN